MVYSIQWKTTQPLTDNAVEHLDVGKHSCYIVKKKSSYKIECRMCPIMHTFTESSTNNAPLLLHKNLLLQNHKHGILHVTVAHSRAPYGISGEMFQWLPISCETFTYPPHHAQWRYFCRTLSTKDWDGLGLQRISKTRTKSLNHKGKY